MIATTDKNKNLLSTSVIFYFHKKNIIYIHRLADNVYLEKEDTFEPLFKKKTPSSLIKSYKKYSGHKIDHYLMIKKEKLLKIMQLTGGCLFFNLYATNISYGEVILMKEITLLLLIVLTTNIRKKTLY